MDVILALSVLMLLSPVLGYFVVAANWTLRTKIVVGTLGAFVMVILPIVVMLVVGGTTSSGY